MAYKLVKQHENAAKFAQKRHVHYLGVVGVVGSNPATPTIKSSLFNARSFFVSAFLHLS